MTPWKLSLALVASLAARAHANVPTPPPPTAGPSCSDPPTLSPDGKTGSCATPAYLQCGASQKDACTTLFDQSFRSYVASSPSKKVILPPAMPHPQGTPGTLYDAAVVPTAPMQVTGQLGPVFESTLRASATAAQILDNYKQYGPVYAYQTPLWSAEIHTNVNDPWRDGAGAQGANRVNECAEYVYKKWWTYSWFDQVAHLPGVDGEMLKAFVVGPANWATLRHPMTRADGLAMDKPLPVLPAGSAIPRNVFFAVDPYWLDASNPDQAAVKTALAGQIGSSMYVSQTDGDELGWAYHQNWRMGPIPEAKLRDNERRMTAYADQLAHWADLQHGYYHARLARVCVGGSKASCKAWADEGGESYAGTGFDKIPFGSTLERRDAAVAYYRSTIDGTATLPSPFTVRFYYGAMPSQTAAYYDGVMTSLRNAQTGVQATMTQALVDEWKYDAAHGCLETTMDNGAVGANSCDFMPQTMVARYLGLFQAERQAAYDRCIRNTGNDFSVARSGGTGVFDDPARRKAYGVTKDFTIGLVALESYFDQYEIRDQLNRDYAQQVEKYKTNLLSYTSNLPLMAGDTVAPKTIGETKDDSHDEGGDWFGGGYSYGYKWHIIPKTQNAADPASPICSLSGDVGAHFEAHAKVLKKTFSIVDANFAVSSTPGKARLDAAHFSILGTSYFNKDGLEFTGTDFNQPLDATPLDWKASLPIPLGPFVLEVGAGASLHVGAQIHAAIVAPPQCDPNNVSWSMNASIAPEVTARAKAWVAINLLIASAGVEGEVDLLKASLPMSADVRLAWTPNGIALKVFADAKLRLTELAGRVNAFVSGPFGLGHADVELFSWDGYHQELGLWHHEAQYPLDAINYRIYGHWDPSLPTPMK